MQGARGPWGSAAPGASRPPPRGAEQLFSTPLGTALALLGVSIGLGNVWRFPYMMGLFGGGAFLLLYLAAVLLLGVPALMAELALGRRTRSGPVDAFVRARLPAGRLWGRLLCLGVAMATSYYLVVLGWILAYLVAAAAALGPGPPLSAGTFAWLQRHGQLQLLCTAAVGAATAAVVARGVRRGIERVSRGFVPVFAVLMVLLAIRSTTLPGARAGVLYLLTPEWEALTPLAVLAAVGQAFFSLGLGGTFFVAYGAFLEGEAPLPRRALTTALGDVAASLVAALAVIPAVFASGLSPASGPSLLFEVLPAACGAMPGGQLFAVAFFLALGCVAFLSGVAAVEVLVGAALRLGWGSSRRVAWAVVAGLVLLGLPATRSLAYLFWSDLVWGSTVQPAGSVVALAALAWGLGRRAAEAEVAGPHGEPPRWVGAWYLWVRYGVPLGVAAALVSGWVL